MAHDEKRVAVVSDDGRTISRHFGRAKYFIIYTLTAGAVSGQEQVEKPVHQGHHGHDHQHDAGHIRLDDIGDTHAHGAEDAGHDHAEMFAPLQGCAAVLSRGMGWGAYNELKAAGVQPIITDIATIEAALAAYSDGTIVDHPEKLH